MKRLCALCVVFIPLFAGLMPAQAANPVQVKESAKAILISNDYLERTLEFADGCVRTTRLRNKVSGRVHEVQGDEFELKLVYERLGYTFGSENPLTLTTRDFTVPERTIEATAEGGKRVAFRLALRRPAQQKTGLEVTLVYELNPEDFFTRQRVQLRTTGQGTYFVDSIALGKNLWPTARFTLGGFGQPLFAEDLFLGLEYPSSLNVAEGPAVRLGVVVGLNIPADGFTSEPAVIAVAAEGRVQAAFMEYVRRIRRAPVRPFIAYNTWYDLQRQAMNHDNTLERVAQLDEQLIKRHGLRLDSFVLDDGWDDMTNLWAIDPIRFPNGFQDLEVGLKEAGSRLGLWFGPVGGYDQREVRIATGRRQGMEITSNGEYLCLAGRNYSRFFHDTLLRLQKEYNLNFFKLDGVPFGCNQADHGHPPGIYSREADLRVFIQLLQDLHRENPEVFLDITTSLWLSPWWLQYADAVWMGGEDYGHLDTLPALSPRQSAMNYRDAVLYSDYRTHQVQFPISSLTTQSIIKGTFLKLGGENESLDDWRDHLVNFLGVGSQLNELYITPSLLSPAEWDALGGTLKWAAANAHPLLDNSTMLLGDPARREPYGFLHFSPGKTLVMLRNPFVRPANADLELNERAGFERTDQTFVAEVIYPFREILPGGVRYGETLRVALDGYEHRIIELRPVAPGEARVEGLRYSLAPSGKWEVGFHLYAPEGAVPTVRLPRASAYEEARVDEEKVALKPEGDAATLTLHFGKKNQPVSRLSFSAPTFQLEESAGTTTARILLQIEVPADFRETKGSVLLEPAQPTTAVKAEASDRGKPATLAVMNERQGLWHWFTMDLGMGSHAIEFQVHLPPGGLKGAKLSGWLRAKRALAAKQLRLTFKPGQRLTAPPENFLPASSDLERLTYALFEKSVF